jgi:hypothetical protein
MPYLTSLDTVVLTQTPIVSLTTGGNDISQFTKCSYQIVYDFTAGTSAGDMILEASNDGVNYVAYPTATIAFTNSSTSDIFEFTSIGIRFARIRIDVTSGTGGLVTIYGHFVRI